MGYENHVASAFSLGALVPQPQHEKPYYLKPTWERLQGEGSGGEGRGGEKKGGEGTEVEERSPQGGQLQSQLFATTGETPSQNCQLSPLIPRILSDTNYCYCFKSLCFGIIFTQQIAGMAP